MKTKLIRHNIILVVTSIIFVFLVTTILMQSEANRMTEKQLISYALLIKADYDGSNEQEVSLKVKKAVSSIQVSFIGVDGQIKYDTVSGGNEDFLTRPEIKQLGTIHVRYSETLSKIMMFYAVEDAGMYVRVALPVMDLSQVFFNFFLILFLIMIAMGVVTVYFVRRLTYHTFIPLNQAVKNFSLLSNDIPPIHDYADETSLSTALKTVEGRLEKHLLSIEEEKNKINFILNSIEQAIIVVNQKRDMVLLNQYAQTLFDYRFEREQIQNIIYLTRNEPLLLAVDRALKSGKNQQFDIQLDARIFVITLTNIKGEWLQEGGEAGLLIMLRDVTKIRNLDQSKREFFYNASHELKSPLTSIIGFLEMIQQGIIQEDELKETVQKTLDESKRSASLIQDMLMLSKLENVDAKREPSLETFSFNELIEDVLQVLQPQMEQKGIRLEAKIHPVTIRANKEEVRILVRNLVDNAIQYNVEKGRIRVGLRQDKQVVFFVEDQGIGISFADQDRIFERFYRVDKARSKKEGGTGLGLAIVKHIVLHLKGKIEVKSELGKGSTFTVTF